MATPSLLFSSGALFGRPLEESFLLAADAGFTGVEVMVSKDPASQDPASISELAARYRLEVGAVHAPCLLVTRKVWGRDPAGKIRRAVEMAALVGAPVVISHQPYRWQRHHRRWIEEELPGLEERTGITVAIENMFPLRAGPGAVTFHTPPAPEGATHLTLDTSHAAVSKQDPRELRRRLARNLRHVHLSDNAGKGWDSHLPPGRGVLDLDGFVADLAGSDYPGAVTLEVDLRRWREDPDRMREIVGGMRAWYEARVPGPPASRETTCPPGTAPTGDPKDG